MHSLIDITNCVWSWNIFLSFSNSLNHNSLSSIKILMTLWFIMRQLPFYKTSLARPKKPLGRSSRNHNSSFKIRKVGQNHLQSSSSCITVMSVRLAVQDPRSVLFSFVTSVICHKINILSLCPQPVDTVIRVHTLPSNRDTLIYVLLSISSKENYFVEFYNGSSALLPKNWLTSMFFSRNLRAD